MGCLRRAGCLLVLAAIAVGLWITQDSWLRVIRHSRPQPEATVDRVWQPLSPEAAARGKKALDGLASARGPVYANLSANEIASYVVQAAGGAFPARADSVGAGGLGDAL